MKTPLTIKLYIGDTTPVWNPENGDYEVPTSESKLVPCFANYISQARVFELYGSRTDRIIIVRFSQEQEPFDKAEIFGKMFKPIDQIDAPIKGAVRLKEVLE